MHLKRDPIKGLQLILKLEIGKKLFMEHLKKENNIRAKNQSKIKSLCAKANE